MLKTNYYPPEIEPCTSFFSKDSCNHTATADWFWCENTYECIDFEITALILQLFQIFMENRRESAFWFIARMRVPTGLVPSGLITDKCLKMSLFLSNLTSRHACDQSHSNRSEWGIKFWPEIAFWQKIFLSCTQMGVSLGCTLFHDWVALAWRN